MRQAGRSGNYHHNGRNNEDESLLCAEKREFPLRNSNHQYRNNYGQSQSYKVNNYGKKPIQLFQNLVKPKKTEPVQQKKEDFVRQQQSFAKLLPSSRQQIVHFKRFENNYPPERVNRQNLDRQIQEYNMKRNKGSIDPQKNERTQNRHQIKQTKVLNRPQRRQKNEQYVPNIRKQQNMPPTRGTRQASSQNFTTQQNHQKVEKQVQKNNQEQDDSVSSEWMTQKPEEQEIQFDQNDSSQIITSSHFIHDPFDNSIKKQDTSSILVPFQEISQKIQKCLSGNNMKVLVQLTGINNIKQIKIKELFLVELGVTVKIQNDKSLKFKEYEESTEQLKKMISISKNQISFPLLKQRHSQFFQFCNIFVCQENKKVAQVNFIKKISNKKAQLIDTKYIEIKLVQVRCGSCFTSFDVGVLNNSIHLSCQSQKECSQQIEGQITKLQIK